ncbi:uncharacterized protein LOC144862785 [Branchiostoma floridae x Branchiostoma japonicum]
MHHWSVPEQRHHICTIGRFHPKHEGSSVLHVYRCRLPWQPKVTMTTALNRRPTLSNNGDILVGRGQLYVCALQTSISTYTCMCSQISTLSIVNVDFFDTTVSQLLVDCRYKISSYHFTVFDNLPSFIKTLRILDCFEAEITKEVLAGLSDVDFLDIGNSISLFTDGYDQQTEFSRINEPLDPVRLDQELFWTVPQLKKLSLHWLYLDTFPKAIYHQTNGQAPLMNLEELDLSFNDIPELMPEFFNNMPKLRSLDMSVNRINNISDSFANMRNLQNLYIRANFLDTLDGSPFEALPGLGTLVLSLMGPVRNVTLPGPAGLKYPTRGSLQFIYPCSFDGLSNLRILDLHQHSILTIQNGTFLHLGSLERLDLSVGLLSAIEEDWFEGLQSLISLDLSYNNLSHISPFNSLPALRSLNLEGNYLESLSDEVFLGLHLLTSLKLGYNHLTDISFDAFKPLIRLELLTLHHNSLTSIEGFLSGLLSTYCEDIDISFNNVSTLDASILPSLAVAERTVTLNLSHNSLTTVYATNSYFDISESQSSKQLILTLDLRWNRLLSIPFRLDRFSFFSLPRLVIDNNDRYRYTKIGLHHRLTVLMRHNPVICDCGIYELLQNIGTAQNGALYTNTDFKEMTCQAPENLCGIKLEAHLKHGVRSGTVLLLAVAWFKVNKTLLFPLGMNFLTVQKGIYLWFLTGFQVQQQSFISDGTAL